MASIDTVDDTFERPSRALMLAELPRALFEGLTLGTAAPLLLSVPHGDGHPVLVLPGFMASDRSTEILRDFLERKRYVAEPWMLGRNLGPRGKVPEMMLGRVNEIFARSGRKISLVGWSLGGIYAREIAKRRADAIRQVITLGSPFGVGGGLSNTGPLYDRLNGDGAATEHNAAADSLHSPPPVPSTAIYSKTDGIVPWQSCLEPETDITENIEVPGSHCGLGVNGFVLYAIAERLSQPLDQWRPFSKRGWRRAFYR